MKLSAFEIRVGNLIEMENSLWKVLRKSHVKPGKGGAFVQLEIKNVVSGTKRNDRFRSEDKIEKAHVEARQMQYLYQEGQNYVFMDNNTYEQMEISADDLGSQTDFLLEGMEVQINTYNDAPIGVELPDNVVLKVIETEGVVKGQTAAGSSKPAVVENGVRVLVPTFISVGDAIKVNTETGEYVERAS